MSYILNVLKNSTVRSSLKIVLQEDNGSLIHQFCHFVFLYVVTLLKKIIDITKVKIKKIYTYSHRSYCKDDSKMHVSKKIIYKLFEEGVLPFSPFKEKEEVD